MLRSLLRDLQRRYFVLDGHAVHELDVVRQELLDVVARVVPVNPVPVAHAHEPVVPDPSKVLHYEVVVLVGL